MATVTIVFGGISKSNFSCGVEERLMHSSTTLDQPLVTTTEKRMELSFGAAVHQLKNIRNGEPTEWHWKSITFFLAMSSPFVESISFIPSKLEVYQKLFVTRGSWAGFLKLEEYGSFWKRKDLRPLNDFAGVEAEGLSIVKEILEAFSNDETSDAIAVTLKHRFDQDVDTFIWAKKPFFQ